jgi:hypothetical protein
MWLARRARKKAVEPPAAAPTHPQPGATMIHFLMEFKREG